MIDRDGNAVASTYTLNFSYGLGLVAEGTGVLLNNELDDFTAKPGAANAFGLVGYDANLPAPGKRPLSSMSPTIVLKDGKPVLVTGSPGGSRIISAVLQVIVNSIDFNMPIDRAVSAPRLHHQWLPDVVDVEPGFAPETLTALQARGHSDQPAAAIDLGQLAGGDAAGLRRRGGPADAGRIGGWVLRANWSGRRDSNPRPRPWQGRALPLSYTRIRRKYGRDSPGRQGRSYRKRPALMQPMTALTARRRVARIGPAEAPVPGNDFAAASVEARHVAILSKAVRGRYWDRAIRSLRDTAPAALARRHRDGSRDGKTER